MSAPATRYQDGIVFQAGGPAGSLSVDSAVGRWDAAAIFVSDAGTSAAKIGRNALGLTDDGITALLQGGDDGRPAGR